MKIKFILMLLCVSFLFTSSVHAGIFRSEGIPQAEKYFKKLQIQHKTLLDYCERQIEAFRYFPSQKWNKWYARWNAKNIDLQEKLSIYKENFPVVYHQFNYNIRMLRVLHAEFEHVFKAETPYYDKLNATKAEVVSGLQDLRDELSYHYTKTALHDN